MPSATAQITDLAFKAQVIATVTQVENIYWDLVNAYESEQINERSLGFANKTLSDDQKQLELKAIPAMQVMTDQSAVATAEGNLTVARASLRLNELLMKNALTKVDDPTIDEMPVIPLDLKAEPDPNADKSIDDLIAEAEKKRPEVAIYQMQAEVQKQALKDINSELLPTLNMYGYYAGAGTAGPKNPNCTSARRNASTDLPTDFASMFENTFNYSSPEYQVGMTLSINLRNRQAKADQFRAVLQYRQSQISSEQQKKNILFDVRNSKFALEQAQARVDAAQKARDLAQKTFDITKQEQQLGAKSSADTLTAENALALAESALDAAQSQYEKAKVDIDRAIGETLERTGRLDRRREIGRGDSCAVESLKETMLAPQHEPVLYLAAAPIHAAAGFPGEHCRVGDGRAGGRVSLARIVTIRHFESGCCQSRSMSRRTSHSQ